MLVIIVFVLFYPSIYTEQNHGVIGQRLMRRGALLDLGRRQTYTKGKA